MAVGRQKYPQRAIERELITTCFRFWGNGTSSPTRTEGIASVVRQNIGDYLVTFPFALKVRGLVVTPTMDEAAGDTSRIFTSVEVIDAAEGKVRVLTHKFVPGADDADFAAVDLAATSDESIILTVLHQDTE